MIDGLAIVDKPAGCTSHDVVARCRRIFGQRRIGHAGTLDPDATGLLLVGLGRATRLLRFLTGLPKTYSGEIVLGVATTTLDSSGEVTGRWDMSGVTLEGVRGAARGLTGTIAQVPPMVSALKLGGRRLHELARAGIEVERAPRTVVVARFDLEQVGRPEAEGDFAGVGGDSSAPVFAFVVECSSGTYVRSLAADLGTALEGGAHLRRLRRTAVGPWGEAEAVRLEDLGPGAVLTPADALRGIPAVRVGDDLARAVSQGKVLDRAVLAISGDGPWPVLNENGRLLAVYEPYTDGRAKPAVVMVTGEP